MNLIFTSIKGESRGFLLLKGGLIGLTLIGFVSFIISYNEGHHLFGTSNLIPWGLPIVITIYLIGLSAGSLIISSLTYVFQRNQYHPISRLAVFLAIVLIFGAMIGIALDLGRPEKSWRLFIFFILNNMRSMFAVNGILYGGYFLISIIYLGAILSDKIKLIKSMGIIAIFWAALVHMGTGAIFGFIDARPIYFSPIKPLEFLAAAMVSGLGLLMLVVVVVFKFTKRNIDQNLILSLSRFLLGLVIALTVMVFIDKLTHLYSPNRDPILWLFTGSYAWIFWGLQVGLGYALPLLLLTHPHYGNSIRGVMIASLSVIIGIFGERFALVIPGLAYPLPFYPGRIEGIWGSEGSFPITSIEVLLSLGIFSLMGFLLLIGLKYLELLPAKTDEK